MSLSASSISYTHHRWRCSCASFTLVEMLLAATVTLILVAVLASLLVSFLVSTSRAKSISRTGQDARFALDIMGRELEGIYRERGGSTNEWFNYTNQPSIGPSGSITPHAGMLMFFSSADDRGSTNGDLCSISYAIAYQKLGTSTTLSFVLDRSRIDPTPTLTSIWGATNLFSQYWSANPPGDPDFFTEDVAEMWIDMGFNQTVSATNQLIVERAPASLRVSGVGYTVAPTDANLNATGARPAYVELYLRVLDKVAANRLHAGFPLSSVTNADSHTLSRKIIFPPQ